MQQLTLFPESAPTLPVNYYPEFLNKEEADELYQHCQELQWQQNTIRMLGKTMPVPRLECIYGDEGCDYLYSKSVLLKPLPEQFAIRNSQFAIMEEFVNLFIWDTEQIISIMKKITTYYQYSEQAHLWVGKEIANCELRIANWFDWLQLPHCHRQSI
jgi:hypothetical protein